MSGHNFSMRLNCSYTNSDNSVAELRVENLVDGEWQVFDLNNNTAGFLVFVYTILTCQHMHFRLSANERELALTSSIGHILVETNEEWEINLLEVDFNGVLHSGDVTQESIDIIQKRMSSCPVSRNLKPITDNKTVVTFE